MSLESDIQELAHRARIASQQMGDLPTDVKNAWLLRVAERLEDSREAILAENARDMQAATSTLR